MIIHVGPKADQTVNFPWLDWQQEKFTSLAIHRFLAETKPKNLGIKRVPNTRLLREVKILDLLESNEGPNTVSDLREILKEFSHVDSMDPEELWALSNDLPYSVNINWTRHGADGCYDVVFRRQSAGSEVMSKERPITFPADTMAHKTWHDYANNPMRGKFTHTLVPELQHFLRGKLPEYMVPSSFIMLHTLPLTPNGKIDRRALPAPDRTRLDLEEDFITPRTPVEEVLVEIWAQVLGLQRIGLHDNFFELGGHSLLLIQLASRIRNAFGVELPLRIFFNTPTIVGMTRAILAKQIEQVDKAKLSQMFSKLKRLPPNKVKALLNSSTNLHQSLNTSKTPDFQAPQDSAENIEDLTSGQQALLMVWLRDYEEALAIARAQAKQIDQEEVIQILSEIEQLSEEEVLSTLNI